LAFLRSPRDPTAQQNLLQDDRWDLSNILICHPESAKPTDFSLLKFPAVSFTMAVFVGNTNFDGNTKFDYVKFRGEDNYFNRAHFIGGASFRNARFDGNIYFNLAHFSGGTDFARSLFVGEASFWGSQFSRVSNFEQTEFQSQVNFLSVKFIKTANFYNARFNKTVGFRDSEWKEVPDFGGVAFKDGLSIADLVLLQTDLNSGVIDWRNTPDPIPKEVRTAGIDWVIALSDSSDSQNIKKKFSVLASVLYKFPDLELDFLHSAPITDRLQALRKMARDADDRPRELDYFALELQSRYQGAGLIKWLVRQYGRFSDYGRGIGCPFGWLAGLWVLSALFYGIVLFFFQQNHPMEWWSIMFNILLLSLVNALPALGVASEARKSSLEALYGCVECVPAVVHMIGVVEGVAAILLLFLIGLGLRNRFRL
jgi:hypothetical protein